MSIFDSNLIEKDLTKHRTMYHLCYVYIPEYKGIKDIEIVVDPHYHCHYDRKNKNLSIEKTDRIPDHFWGRGIHSLAAIVGDNGVGKSTAVEFILQAVVDGYNDSQIDAILVYEQETVVYVYSQKEIQIPENVKRLSRPGKICCLYYSGHFIPGLSLYNLRCGELAGNYNMSDGFLLMKDVQNYSNKDYLHSNLTFGEHLSQYNAQNNIRICEMLANPSLYERIKDFCIPKYILFSLNLNGIYALKEYDNQDVIPKNTLKHKDKKENLLTSLIYNNFLNILFNASHRDIDENILESLRQWLGFFTGERSVLEQFEEFIRTQVADFSLIRRLTGLHEALTKLDLIAQYQPQITGVGYYFLEIAQNHDKITELVDMMESSGYITAQYFDIYYAQDLYSDTVLSSGEQKLLDLFSRLYAAIQKDREKFSNLQSPALLILDEAEHAFHPEWQRKYIHLLLSFLKEMMVVPGLKFQVLLTTHSPILLSDIPSDCITFLKKENDTTKNVIPENRGTFAANVFELYRNSFFLNEGMIGKFAAEKLNWIENRIREGGSLDRDNYLNLLKEINLIGDYRIKDYFMSLMPDKRSNDERAFLLDRLRYLEKKETDEQN